MASRWEASLLTGKRRHIPLEASTAFGWEELVPHYPPRAVKSAAALRTSTASEGIPEDRRIDPQQCLPTDLPGPIA